MDAMQQQKMAIANRQAHQLQNQAGAIAALAAIQEGIMVFVSFVKNPLVSNVCKTRSPFCVSASLVMSGVKKTRMTVI